MSEIAVDHLGMAGLLASQRDATDAVETAIDRMPGAVDGGVASAMIGLLVAAAAESSAIVVDSERVFLSVAVGALSDFGRTEEQILQDIDQLGGSVEYR